MNEDNKIIHDTKHASDERVRTHVSSAEGCSVPRKVFVSGCYDLLHSGHVEFFKQAAQYGEL